MFVMKWKDSNEAGSMLVKQTRRNCPWVVIAFYEETLTWHSCPKDEAQ